MILFFIYIVKKSKNINIFSTQVFDILPICYRTVKNGSFHSTLSCCQTHATVYVLMEEVLIIYLDCGAYTWRKLHSKK